MANKRTDTLELKGKVAIVTGGTRGIGRAIALKLAANGASLVIGSTESGRAKAEEALAAISAVQGDDQRVRWVAGDLASSATGKKIVAAAVEAFGRIDILINNVGTREDALFIRMKPAQWSRIMDVNVNGPFALTQAAIRQMLKQRTPAAIVFLSSLATHGNPGQANYAASKSAVEGLARTLGVEYAARGIRVNVVAPGLVGTDLTSDLSEEQWQALVDLVPLGRAVTPEEVAEAVMFFASDRSSGITSQVLNVDGGVVR